MKELLVLGIETSGMVCSVAWYQSDRILLEYNIEIPHIHATLLAKLVMNGFEMLAILPSEIDLVAVAAGPGSFTGLRIGMSYAKGFCYGLGKPIKGVSNFEVLAISAPLSCKEIMTIIDARHNNYYMALFSNGQKQIETKRLMSKNELARHITNDTIIVTNQPVSDMHAPVIHGRYSAGLICRIGLHTFLEVGADELENLEPSYMQPFAGVS
jgi:tRNA threonylcarbamoyladenosine biosynthesis protein TsaB